MTGLSMADVPSRLWRSEDPAALAEAVALAGIVEAEAPGRLAEWLRDRLESAGTPAQLLAEWRRVRGYGDTVPAGDLWRVAVLRLDALAAQARREVVR